jgi:hypothetical protein
LSLALVTVRFVGFPRAALATLRASPRLAEFPLLRFARLCAFDAFLRLAMIAPVPVGVSQRIMPLTQMFAFTSLTRLAQCCTDPPGKIGAGRRASRRQLTGRAGHPGFQHTRQSPHEVAKHSTQDGRDRNEEQRI